MKICDIINLAANTTLNGKVMEVKKEIPSITNLVITTALNGKINDVKNKISNITNLILLLISLLLRIKHLMLVI